MGEGRQNRQTTANDNDDADADDIKHFALNVFCYSLDFSIAHRRPPSPSLPTSRLTSRFFGLPSLVSVLLCVCVQLASTPHSWLPCWVVNINEGYFACTRWQTKSKIYDTPDSHKFHTHTYAYVHVCTYVYRVCKSFVLNLLLTKTCHQKKKKKLLSL